MMKKYKVEIQETLSRLIEVEADSESDAWEIVSKQYRNSEIILGGDDFEDYTINVL